MTTLTDKDTLSMQRVFTIKNVLYPNYNGQSMPNVQEESQ